jgi:AcrR family transcriptional regulator
VENFLLQTTTRRSPRRQPRSDESRTKILEAAIALIGEVGPFGLTLALVGERADVSRALPTYQFHTRQELLAVAARMVLEADVDDQDLGLEPLLAWMQHELEAAAAGAPELRARLSLIMGPSDHSTQSAVAIHWTESAGRIQRHLERGQVLRQVRTDLDAGASATALLGQLYGEMARVARGVGQANADVFLALTRAAIAPTGTPRRQAPRRPTQEQPRLL